MFLRYIVRGSHTLTELSMSLAQQKDELDYFMALENSALYSRLVSGFKFENLSEDKKDEFLFLKSDKNLSVDKQELYNKFMPLLIQESHNRTCYALGVKPTVVNFIAFSKEDGFDEEDWFDFRESDGKIYLNSNKRYDLSRPSILLENINMATRQYSVYANIFKAVSKPENLDNKEYFLALTTAIKTYVYDKLAKNDPECNKQMLAVDYTTPIEIEKTIFSFEQTRKDFQSAKLYGGILRDKLRQDEEIYHDYLSDEGVADSLINLEDLFQNFKAFLVVNKMDASFGKIFEAIEKEYFSDYYSSLGADSVKGQGIENYIDYLEKEMFDRVGITMEEYLNYKNGQPSEREIDEGYGDDERVSERVIDEGYGDDEVPGYASEDEFDSYDLGAGEENATYKPMDSVLKDEGKIFNTKLPFSNLEAGEGMNM